MRALDKATPGGEPGTGVETHSRQQMVGANGGGGDGEGWDSERGGSEGGGEGEGGSGGGDDGREDGEGDGAVVDTRTGDDDRKCGIVGG
jgi:hypothetical protein